jgi:hypothetical protein
VTILTMRRRLRAVLEVLNVLELPEAIGCIKMLDEETK